MRAASWIREKALLGDRQRVLFLNDLGYQFGAGIAHLRQIQSFLLLGYEVAGICWGQGSVEESIPFVPQGAKGVWLGMRQLLQVHPDKGYDASAIVQSIVTEVEALHPHVVIVGNLHAAKWPLEVIPALRDLGCTVVAYMHDCYLATGRCAYPGPCDLYATGCNETCPTADEYPSLAPEKIPGAWRLRREIFCGENGISLAANSRWTLGMAESSMKGMRHGAVVYYGLDARLFRPIDRALARRMLKIPQDAFVILGGAINLSDQRKGTNIFREVIQILDGKARFLVFGAESGGLDGVYATGLLRDYRKMPLVYSAADLFVGTSQEEAFGQTLCEASACGIPIVAFRRGGIPEIARQDLNARLVDSNSASDFIVEIEGFMQDAEKRRKFGEAGRALVQEEFTIERQADRWRDYLRMERGSVPNETVPK